MRYFPHLP
jgi:hypothetical protein